MNPLQKSVEYALILINTCILKPKLPNILFPCLVGVHTPSLSTLRRQQLNSYLLATNTPKLGYAIIIEIVALLRHPPLHPGALYS